LGARSFYAQRPILAPEDLSGLKVRTMGSAIAIEMMQALGGSATPMPYGEIYTALQQNVIDGAENNVGALTLSRHGEVAKHYSLDEHIRAPDVLVISTEVWDTLAPDHQALLHEVIRSAVAWQREAWAEMEAREFEAAAKLGVQVHTPNREAFRARVLSIHREVSGRGDDYRELVDALNEAGSAP
ncbi:MAG: TRAP transporter substrate-binding protein DctP, partial [Myxococcota bacterium]